MFKKILAAVLLMSILQQSRQDTTSEETKSIGSIRVSDTELDEELDIEKRVKKGRKKKNRKNKAGKKKGCNNKKGKKKAACKARANAQDGKWSTYSTWSDCQDLSNDDCGEGYQTRTRACTNPAPVGNGKPCVGDDTELQNCSVDCELTHGEWSTYSEWSDCQDLSEDDCGEGSQTRTRTCTNPAPVGNGNPCVGTDTDTQDCSVQCKDSHEEDTTCLSAHNTLRQLHSSTPNLEWDDDLAAKAQVYAETLRDINKDSTETQLIHENPSGGMGENLYWRDNKKLGTCAGASLAWYNEIDDYSYDTASSINGKAIGHFTQVVWKGTMKFGVGIATMDSRKYSQYGNMETFIVAKYSPQGNSYMTGQKLQYYTENVQPRKIGAVTPTLEELDPSQKQACENAKGDSTCDYFMGPGNYTCDGDNKAYFKEYCYKKCGYCVD